MFNAIIWPLALRRKHDSKNPLLRDMSKNDHLTKTNIQQLNSDPEIKNRMKLDVILYSLTQFDT